MERLIGTVTGVICLCLMLSILASHIQELLASYSSQRAATLERAIRNMLVDPKLVEQFYQHPLIQSISLSRAQLTGSSSQSKQSRPAYVAPESFCKVLHFILMETYAPQTTSLGALIAAMPDSGLQHTLKTVALDAPNDPAIAMAIERWYSDTMDRVAGLYKRKTQWSLLMLGFLLAALLDVNMFQVTQKLWEMPDIEQKMSVLATQYTSSTPGQPPSPNLKTLQGQLAEFPIGWVSNDAENVRSLAEIGSWPKGGRRAQAGMDLLWFGIMLLGWLLTALAVSLGAPFWFDLLNQVVNLRITGPKPNA